MYFNEELIHPPFGEKFFHYYSLEITYVAEIYLTLISELWGLKGCATISTCYFLLLTGAHET